MSWITSSGGVSRWSLAAGGVTPFASQLASARPLPQQDWGCGCWFLFVPNLLWKKAIPAGDWISRNLPDRFDCP